MTGLVVCRQTVSAILQKSVDLYRTESDTSSVVEDVDGVEGESHEIKLGKVKGRDRRTPQKNVGKHASIRVTYI
jgi:hypothetical protein